MNNNTFSYEDLATMSDGIIALINTALKAQLLVPDDKSREAIEEYLTRLHNLNAKICNEMGKFEKNEN